MSDMMQAVWIMGAVGLIIGFCGGYFYGSWATERQHAKERAERQRIADLVKAARIDQQHRRVAQ
jgi:hypothetical protein